jgi:rubrerythrin
MKCSTRFCRGVAEAIRDESNAIRFYGELADMAPTSAVTATIRHIRRDEMRHRRALTTRITTS